MTTMTGERPEPQPAAPRHRWLPQQHGAWAMLLLPLLLGVVASRPDPWQIVIGGAALSGYLASAVGQAWFRARRPAALRTPLAVYGGTFTVLGLALVVAFPALLLALLVIGPAALIVLGGARPGTRRDIADSLAQVAQALVLVPATAYVSGDVEVERVVTATAIAAGYLVGTVLVVRSVLRERRNSRFAGLSIGFHAALAVLALARLPLAYVLLAVALTLRAAGLPWLQRRLAGGARPLRPIHVGLVEIGASVAVVLAAFLAPP